MALSQGEINHTLTDITTNTIMEKLSSQGELRTFIKHTNNAVDTYLELSDQMTETFRNLKKQGISILASIDSESTEIPRGTEHTEIEKNNSSHQKYRDQFDELISSFPIENREKEISDKDTNLSKHIENNDRVASPGLLFDSSDITSIHFDSETSIQEIKENAKLPENARITVTSKSIKQSLTNCTVVLSRMDKNILDSYSSPSPKPENKKSKNVSDEDSDDAELRRIDRLCNSSLKLADKKIEKDKSLSIDEEKSGEFKVQFARKKISKETKKPKKIPKDTESSSSMESAASDNDNGDNNFDINSLNLANSSDMTNNNNGLEENNEDIDDENENEIYSSSDSSEEKKLKKSLKIKNTKEISLVCSEESVEKVRKGSDDDENGKDIPKKKGSIMPELMIPKSSDSSELDLSVDVDEDGAKSKKRATRQSKRKTDEKVNKSNELDVSDENVSDEDKYSKIKKRRLKLKEEKKDAETSDSENNKNGKRLKKSNSKSSKNKKVNEKILDSSDFDNEANSDEDIKSLDKKDDKKDENSDDSDIKLHCIRKTRSGRKNVQNKENDKKNNSKKDKEVVTASGSNSSSVEEMESSDLDSMSSKKSSKNKKERKKRKIKIKNSSSDNKDSEEDEETRHKLRKVINDKKLDKTTLEAQKAEKERKKRVEERKSLAIQNEGISDSEQNVDPMDTSITTITQKSTKVKEFWLDIAKDGTKRLQIDPIIACVLKPHQIEGVQFMWDSVFENLDLVAKDDPGSGALLAHCMGLGKTLQVIALVHTVLANSELTKVNKVLVLLPINVQINWANEVTKWTSKCDVKVNVYDLPSDSRFGIDMLKQRIKSIERWVKNGGIFLMGYTMFARLVAGVGIKTKVLKERFRKGLLCADLVVCDEGHLLKSEKTNIAKTVYQVETQRRIVLTGTPLQNNLIEYHCMVSFVKPNLLGTKKEFANRFVNPINNGSHRDSTPADVAYMKKRAHVLHNTLDGCVQRRDYDIIRNLLPPKHEFVLLIRMSEKQIILYRSYMEGQRGIKSSEGKVDSMGGAKSGFKGAQLFKDFQTLSRIWTHPWVLKINEIRVAIIESRNVKSFVNDDSSASESESESDDGQNDENQNGHYKDELDDSNVNNDKKKKAPNRKRITDSDNSNCEIINDSLEDENENTKNEKDDDDKDLSGGSGSSGDDSIIRTKKKGESTDESDFDDDNSNNNGTRRSTLNNNTVKSAIEKYKESRQPRKTKNSTYNSVVSDVEEIESEEETHWWSEMVTDDAEFELTFSGKMVIFEQLLRLCEQKGDKLIVFSQSLMSLDLIEKFLNHFVLSGQHWTKGVDYLRLDGSVDVAKRNKDCEIFNDRKNIKARLYLISTRAGGIGINLVGANRCIVFDACWNPSYDTQSIFRIYRFGQTKEVFIYRFLSQGTMEEKIYQRQVNKQSLAQRVVDEHQLDSHFTSNELRELYNFEPNIYDPEIENVPAIPDDDILKTLLLDCKRWISSYHEHDSLLENKISEGLSEEERKAAWAEFEAEKNGQSNQMPSRTYASYEEYLYYNPHMNPELQNNNNQSNGGLHNEQITNQMELVRQYQLKLMQQKMQQQQNQQQQAQRYQMHMQQQAQMRQQQQKPQTQQEKDFQNQVNQIMASQQQQKKQQNPVRPTVADQLTQIYSNSGRNTNGQNIHINGQNKNVQNNNGSSSSNSNIRRQTVNNIVDNKQSIDLTEGEDDYTSHGENFKPTSTLSKKLSSITNEPINSDGKKKSFISNLTEPTKTSTTSGFISSLPNTSSSKSTTVNPQLNELITKYHNTRNTDERRATLTRILAISEEAYLQLVSQSNNGKNNGKIQNM